jgi:hypothetical protein
METERYNIGDKVRLLNAVGEGVVTRTLGADKVMVLIDGFNIACNISDIVVVEKNLPQQQEISVHTRPTSIAPTAHSEELDQQGDEYEISVAFLPPKNMKTDLYLLNDSAYQLYYSAGFCRDGQITPISHGHVDADSKLFIKSLAVGDLKEQKTLWIEALFFKNIEYLPVGVRQAKHDFNFSDIRLAAKNLFKDNDFFDDKALIVPLLSKDTENPASASISPNDVPPYPYSQNDISPTVAMPAVTIVAPSLIPAPAVQKELHTVDLRAAVLRLQLGYLSEKDLLKAQMERAEAGIATLLDGKCKKCVLIYGLGSGQTKTDIQVLLNTKYPQLCAEDASEREYHYGAVMVKMGEA